MTRYSKEFLIDSHKMHLSGMSLRQVAINVKSDPAKLKNAWLKLGLQVSDGRRRTNPNDNFFSSIETEIQAYLLGFFASDGHIEKRSYGSYTLKWDIQARDQELLELINKYIGNNTYNIFKLKARDISGISITSKQIGEDLLALGYDNNKTHSMHSLPNIDTDLMRHFIRGYFDGDGSISISKAKKGYNRCFSIASCYSDILLEIKDCLPSTTYYIKEFKKVFGSRVTDSATISCHNKSGLKEIYSYLYKDSSYFLKRKHDKFLLAIA